MQKDVEEFVTRSVPLGYTDQLRYERALVTVDGCTWVVLREDRQRLPGTRPVLTSCFEYVANSVRQELVFLQGRSDQLRFFHCQYQMPQTGQLGWSVREVLLMRKNGLYAFGSWSAVSPSTQETLNAALNLWQQPQRMLP